MKLLAFDVETWGTQPTYGLQPFRARTGEAWLTSYALASFAGGRVKTGGKVQPTVSDLEAFLRTAARAGVHIVGWNTAFDVAWLIALGLRDLVYTNKWLDGMLLYKHLTAKPKILGRPSYSLKSAVAEFFPEHAGYEAGVDFGDMTPEGVAKRLVYNQEDGAFTLRLAVQFLERMNPEMRRNALIEAACIPLVAESIVDGVHVDEAAAAELGAKMEEQRRTALVKLKLRADCASINETVLASPTKLRKVLFDEWRLPVVGMTKPSKKYPHGQPSTDKDALTILGYEDPRAKLIHQYREAKNLKTKFCDGVIVSAEYNGDGVCRPTPRIAGTYTGRMTYSAKVSDKKRVEDVEEDDWEGDND